MLTAETVKRDLCDIRYYYSRKAELVATEKVLGPLAVRRTAAKYNCAVKGAPLRLYDLYASLYVAGTTQEAVALELGYTPQYIRKLIAGLVAYFQKNIE